METAILRLLKNRRIQSVVETALSCGKTKIMADEELKARNTIKTFLNNFLLDIKKVNIYAYKILYISSAFWAFRCV